MSSLVRNANAVGEVTPSLFSSVHSGAASTWGFTKAAFESANVPGRLSHAANHTKEFATERVAPAAEQAGHWCAENPWRAAACGAAAVGLGAMAAPGVVAAPLLGAAGFGGQGIVGGSVAAGAQSVIGNVAASSLFATLQSAGMAGYGVAVVNTVVQVGGACLATASGGLLYAKSKTEEGVKEEETVEEEKQEEETVKGGS
ncbi:hypothetical protein JX265_002416 [Neoarthrinium moseri]|uniref:Uncharacterized protein n=1 Tax=Neoarthrinium moseri TaxID=1658444 RepID=A0A9Q0ATH1_9PEZI|nr:hypothetical protein JX265_002416 [Neoarthrinium moseri]